MSNILFDISGKIEPAFVNALYEVKKIADSQTLKTVKEILDDETGEQSRYRLVEDMVSGTFMSDDQFDEILYKII